MGMDPSENSDDNSTSDEFAEIFDNEDSFEMKIIDSNIEKCIAELKESFENLTTNMVLVESADQVKYKK